VKQGRNWVKMQQTEKAEQVFQKVLTADTHNVDAYFNLGKIANERGDSAVAVRNLEKAVELDGENSAAVYQLGLAYRKTGQAQKSAAAMTRFRQLTAKTK
jgi:tetratricopeptide (TPR) repeat protein